MPIFKENTYDYDSIIEIKSIDSSSDFKGLKLILSNIFDEIEWKNMYARFLFHFDYSKCFIIIHWMNKRAWIFILKYLLRLYW